MAKRYLEGEEEELLDRKVLWMLGVRWVERSRLAGVEALCWAEPEESQLAREVQQQGRRMGDPWAGHGWAAEHLEEREPVVRWVVQHRTTGWLSRSFQWDS